MSSERLSTLCTVHEPRAVHRQSECVRWPTGGGGGAWVTPVGRTVSHTDCKTMSESGAYIHPNIFDIVLLGNKVKIIYPSWTGNMSQAL